MGSLVARILIWFIPGWVIFESIREFNKLFNLQVNPYLGIVPTALGYVLSEIVIRKWKTDESAVLSSKPIKSKLDRLFYFIAWVLFASLFLAILFVWAGAIYKQIVTGYDSYDALMK